MSSLLHSKPSGTSKAQRTQAYGQQTDTGKACPQFLPL